MIGTLEFFRIIAFIAIFLHHLSYRYDLGVIGVSLFFVLAGFISAYTNILRFQTISVSSIVHFYQSRLIRIYPIYILTFIISLPIVHYTNFKSKLIHTVNNLLMMQSWSHNGIQIFSYNSVSWFISDIWFFSLLTPFLLFFFNKSGLSKSILKLACICCVVWGITVYVAVLFKVQIQPFNFAWWFIYASPYFRIADYLIGMMIGLIFINLKQNSILIKSYTKFTYSVLEISSLVLFAGIYYTHIYAFDAIIMSSYYTPVLAISLLVFAFQRGFVSSLINKSLSMHFGRLTYSAFMVHQLVISYIVVLFLPSIQGPVGDFKHFFAQAIVFIFVISLSDSIYRYWEIPVKEALTLRLTSYDQ